MTNKMTNVSVLNDVINGVALTQEHIEKLTKIRDSFARKSGGERKPTKAQLENEVLLKNIEEFMSTTEGAVAVADIASHFGVSTSKVAPQLGKLARAGKVERTEEKRHIFYKWLG